LPRPAAPPLSVRVPRAGVVLADARGRLPGVAGGGWGWPGRLSCRWWAGSRSPDTRWAAGSRRASAPTRCCCRPGCWSCWGRVGVAGPAVLSLVGGLALTGYALGGGKLLGVGSDPLLLPAGLLVVLGLVGLIPGVVTALGRRAGRLPLPLRLAVRDAARHRT